ncbi:MAG: hypothetical protein PHP73_01200 [Candidatus Omnitrophica bacterium]|nr:hypothetical protein [Candidatus Omnitrophota bacterium]
MAFKEKLQTGKLAAVLSIFLILFVIAWPLLHGASDGKLYQFLAYVIDKSPECASCPPQNVSVSNIMNARKEDPSVLTITVGSSPHIGKLVIGAQYRFYIKIYQASNSLELIYYEEANNQQPMNDYAAQRISFPEFLRKLGK